LRLDSTSSPPHGWHVQTLNLRISCSTHFGCPRRLYHSKARSAFCRAATPGRSGAAAIEVLQRRGAHFIRPHPEFLQYVRAKRRNERDIRRVAPSGDGDAADARRFVARVESEPAPIEKPLEPGIIVHRCRVRWHANVAQESIPSRAGIFMQRQKVTARWAKSRQ